jgi:hypothetical protein
MAVPEASVHKNDLPLAAKDEVRLTREIGNVQAIPEAKAVDEPPNSQLRRRVLASDTPHCLASLGL